MEQINKKKMFGVYASEDQLLLLKKCALEQKKSLTDFVLTAALEKVRQYEQENGIAK